MPQIQSNKRKITALLGAIFVTIFSLVSINQLVNNSPFMNADLELNQYGAAGNNGSMTFTSDKTNFNVNDTFDVRVMIDTAGTAIDSYSVLMTYDPTYLKPVNNPPFTDGDIPMIPVTQSNSIISDPPLVRWQEMSFDGWSGAGKAATVQFTAIHDGNTKLSCYKDPSITDPNYNYSNTNDCDLGYGAGGDAMSNLIPLNLTIQGNQPANQTITSGPNVGNITQNNATITWKTLYPGDSVVEYGTSTNYGQSASSGNQTADHSITLNNLTPNTGYFFRAKTTNSSHSPATVISDPGGEFRTLPPNAQNSFTTGPLVSYVNRNSALITWGTSQEGNSVVNYGTDVKYGKNASDQTQTKSHSITLNNLTADTTYHFSVTTTRGGDNLISPDKTFRTYANNAPTPPPPKNLNTGTTGGTSQISYPISATLSKVSLSKNTIKADSSDSVTISITLKDTKDQTITNVTPMLSVTGSKNEIKSLGLKDNTWRFNLYSTKPETKTITIKANGVQLSTTPKVEFIEPTGAFSKAKYGLYLNQKWLLPILYAVGLSIIVLCVYLIYKILKTSRDQTGAEEIPSP